MSISDHLQRAEANYLLLQSLPDWKKNHPSWYIAIAFYTSLHYVRALAAKHGLRVTQHRDIRSAPLNSPFGKIFHSNQIATKYFNLEDMSRDARYEVPEPSWQDQDLDIALNIMEHIRSKIGKQLNN